MSSLFEKAIADAKELKETALRNAEKQLIEKYSVELKESLENLLEQDEEEELEATEEETAEGGEEMAMDMEMDAEPAEPTGDDSLMAQVPDAATVALAQALEDDQEEIVIDFDELMADYEASTPEEEAEEVPADAEAAIDREELLEPEAEMDMMEEGEGLDEAIDALTEEQLDALLEEVNVDIKSQHPNNGWAGSTAGDRAENADLAALAAAVDEEQEKNKELQDQNKMLSEQLQEAKTKLKKAKEVLLEMKTKAAEVNLQNARLFYTTQTLSSQELNTRQKSKIVESLAKAKTIEETKLVYETMKDSVGSTNEKTAPESLTEAVSRTRSLVVSSRKREDKQQEQAPMFKNWRKLAGIE
jgi:hypothetical protein